MMNLRNRIYYKILPFVLRVTERFEATEYENQKLRLADRVTILGNNHLFLTHGRGGGADKYVEDKVAALKAKNAHGWILHYEPLRRRFILSCGKIHAENKVIYKFPSQYAKMVSHLKSLGLTRLHINHIRYLPYYFVKDLPNFAQDIGIPYDYTLHDFIAFCPRVHLIDSNWRYCGMPQEAASCNACIRRNGQLTTAPHDMEEWRETGRALINKASEIIAPSHDTADRHRQILGEMKINVAAHDTPQTNLHAFPAKPSDEPYVIAVIGRIHRHKGADILLACAQDAAENNLPIRFAVIGDSVYREQLRKAGVSITGAYKEEELPQLLKHSGASLVFLPSLWPETYSYVLSHIWQNGYFPVSFDLGAPAERIKQTNKGLVLPLNIADSPKKINNALLEAAHKQHG